MADKKANIPIYAAATPRVSPTLVQKNPDGNFRAAKTGRKANKAQEIKKLAICVPNYFDRMLHPDFLLLF